MPTAEISAKLKNVLRPFAQLLGEAAALGDVSADDLAKPLGCLRWMTGEGDKERLHTKLLQGDVDGSEFGGLPPPPVLRSNP